MVVLRKDIKFPVQVPAAITGLSILAEKARQSVGIMIAIDIGTS